jgi:SAM-dependent methyltransferase
VSELNRTWWDERVALHVASDFYDVDSFTAGRVTLQPFELEEVGDVAGRSLLHLQCHFGLDTLSWARRGARVTGLDFSAPAVEAAARLASGAGLDADFVAGDVYDAPAVLAGRRFDVVYTGLGAIGWLPDIERWAQVVAELVAPGGFFYLSEFHPITWVLGDDMSIERDYFDRGPHGFDYPGTYADEQAETVNNRTEEYQHTLGDVVSAVIAAGLTIEFLHEHDYTLFGAWPVLERQEEGRYRFPAGRPRLPLMYSMRARS